MRELERADHLEVYQDDPCPEFMPRLSGNEEYYAEKDKLLIARMHKAISIIQFKLEGQLLKRRPEFDMNLSIRSSF